MEAEVGRKEKDAAAAAKKTASPTKKTAAPKPTGRIKVVWLVCDHSGSPVETYPYAQEQAARGDAERRTQESGKPHFVTRGEVPLE